MKKLLVGAILVVAMCTGCNKQVIDTTYHFNRAIINLPDGSVIKGDVDSWNDYDSDQIQVKIDGVMYLVHSNNVVLISE